MRKCVLGDFHVRRLAVYMSNWVFYGFTPWKYEVLSGCKRFINCNKKLSFSERILNENLSFSGLHDHVHLACRYCMPHIDGLHSFDTV